MCVSVWGDWRQEDPGDTYKGIHSVLTPVSGAAGTGVLCAQVETEDPGPVSGGLSQLLEHSNFVFTYRHVFHQQIILMSQWRAMGTRPLVQLVFVWMVHFLFCHGHQCGAKYMYVSIVYMCLCVCLLGLLQPCFWLYLGLWSCNGFSSLGLPDVSSPPQGFDIIWTLFSSHATKEVSNNKIILPQSRTALIRREFGFSFKFRRTKIQV